MRHAEVTSSPRIRLSILARVMSTRREHAITMKLPLRRLLLLLLAVLIASTARPPYTTHAVTLPMALPEVFVPFSGDARLEPIPDNPIQLANIPVFTTDQFGNQKLLDMRFPPRVNGQSQSDGDKHADLYVLFNEATSVMINQRMIIEAAPLNAAGPGTGGSELKARLFSPIWEVHAVLVNSTYDPTDPAQLIDSVEKVFSSPLVHQIFQTNIFVNCPIVPNGSTVAANSAQPEQVFFEGQLVTIVPYDIEDGPFNTQVLFKFENASGQTLGHSLANPLGPMTTQDDLSVTDFIPHLVASHALGDPFYTSIWDLWTVVVPDGFDVSVIKGKDPRTPGDPAAVKTYLANGTATMKSSGIRLDCPVVAVTPINGGVLGTRAPVPVEDLRTFIAKASSSGFNFVRTKFPFDKAPTTFTKSRTFQITEVTPGGIPDLAITHATNGFPDITPEVQGKGNVIPIILKHPFQTVGTSGPATNGDFYHVDQADIDAGTLGAGIESNIAALIAEGNLAPDWAPGIRPFQDRLAVVGRAIFELFWMPEQGANVNDVTTCLPCHDMPSSGASARGLYNLERAIVGANTGAATRGNAGSMFGSGPASILIEQLIALHNSDPTKGLEAKTDTISQRVLDADGVWRGKYRKATRGASGSQGTIAVIRADVAGASNTHFGVQSAEFIMGQSSAARTAVGCSGATPMAVVDAMACDLDHDGVVGEMTVGDVTAETVFLLTLPVPDEMNNDVKMVLQIQQASVDAGRQLFRKSIAAGGVGCASCHTPFFKFDPGISNPDFTLSNPQTGNVLTLDLPFHVATQEDVTDHLADWVGQRGLRTWGDFKQHRIGLDTVLTSTSPNPLVVSPTNVSFLIFDNALCQEPANPACLMHPTTDPSTGTLTTAWNLATAKTAELWDAGSSAPLMRTGNAGFDIKGVILAHAGEATASRNAFAKLKTGPQQKIIDFLRAQTIQSKVGEGSGATLPREITPVP